MRKLTLGVCCLVCVFVSGMALDVLGEESDETMCVPLGNITLSPPEGVEAEKAAVEFPHAVHFATECKTCHHKWKGEAKIKGCMTSGCHDRIKAPVKSKRYLSYTNEAIMYYKYAYHKMCVGCHRDIKRKNKEIEDSYRVAGKIQDTGPASCEECHPKE